MGVIIGDYVGIKIKRIFKIAIDCNKKFKNRIFPLNGALKSQSLIITND